MGRVEIRRDLGPYRDSWDRFVVASDLPVPALRSWWLEGVAQPHSRFVLVVEEARLLGGVAIDLRRQRWTGIYLVSRFAGQEVGPRDQDIVAEPHQRARVVEQLAVWFRRLPHCVVDLDGVRAQSDLRTAIPSAVDEHSDAAPCVLLADDFEAYLASRSRNYRKGIRRDERRLTERGYTYRKLEPDEIELGLAAMRRLHELRFGEASAWLPYFEGFAAAARAGVRRGELSFHVISNATEIVAIDAVLEVAGYADDPQGGWDNTREDVRGAGMVLMAKIIEELTTRGLRELDLNPTTSGYKMRMTDHVRPVHRVRAHWGWKARLSLAAQGGLRFVLRVPGGLRRRMQWWIVDPLSRCLRQRP